MSPVTLTLDGLEDLVARAVEQKIAEVLAQQSAEDPWYDSGAAAEYLGVSRQRIHDLTHQGLLPRIGEKGERLFFRRSTLDAYRQGAPSNEGLLP